MKCLKQYLKEDWWSDLGSEGQEAYINSHPNSKKAKEARAEDKAETSNNSTYTYNNEKEVKFNKRQKIKGKEVKIPHFTEEEIKKSKREPYLFTKKGQEEYTEIQNARSAGNEEEAQRLETEFLDNNKKYNAESVAHLKGALSTDKYYVSARDFNDPKSGNFDVLTVNSLNDDGTYTFQPVGGKPSDRLNSNWIDQNLIELDTEQAKQLQAAMGIDGPFGGLTHGEEQLVQTYTYATPENSALRQGKKSERAEKMKKIIDKCYNNKTNLYRGITGDYAKKLLSLKPGDTITEPGFSSTSSDIDIAKNFAKDGVVLDIDVPEGWGNFINASEYTMHPEEQESILNSGAKFKVENIDGNIIKVKLLPFEEDK